MSTIRKILIANRGEIACRIVGTCRIMGIQTVTVFAADDRDLPHAFAGDQAVALEGKTLAETYLNHAALIDAAKRTGAEAIHPGYGFLSENAAFAKAVTDAGLIFIGPPADVIARMGDKAASRLLCQEINVPTVPGYDGDSSDDAALQRAAQKIGYPVLVKASAGGGGKGMRIVQNAREFLPAVHAARAEAKNAFGNDQLLIEKYLMEPRHIELQVFSDTHGNHVHLFERECSIQRRYQKIIEESPSPVLTEKTRSAMVEAALSICRTIGYVGAGTVEFIVSAKGEFYFLEMNTRLQVEHPVTEMITGLDLVRWQMDVAMGKPLPLKQADIVRRGHAMEVRLYAEDTARDFLPAPGTLRVFSLPQLPLTRAENGYVQGSEVSASYDPMIAKLVAWGETRAEAIARMQLLLSSARIGGVKNNRRYLQRILAHPEFVAGNTTTHFVKTHAETLAEPSRSEDALAALAAAYVLATSDQAAVHTSASNTEYSAWVQAELAGFR